MVGRILYTYIVYVRSYVENLAARVYRQSEHNNLISSHPVSQGILVLVALAQRR